MLVFLSKYQAIKNVSIYRILASTSQKRCTSFSSRNTFRRNHLFAILRWGVWLRRYFGAMGFTNRIWPSTRTWCLTMGQFGKTWWMASSFFCLRKKCRKNLVKVEVGRDCIFLETFFTKTQGYIKQTNTGWGNKNIHMQNNLGKSGKEDTHFDWKKTWFRIFLTIFCWIQCLDLGCKLGCEFATKKEIIRLMVQKSG